MISRERAQELIDQYLSTDYLKWHVRETEVIMQALAEKLGEDVEIWGLTGLLHDLDMDEVGEDHANHGAKTIAILENEDCPEEMLHAIQAHAENLGYLGVARENKLDYALAAAENLTGFLVACALVQPDKKISSVKLKSVNKKLKKKDFARKVNREFIADIEKAGISQDELIEIGLEAVASISDEIGL